MEIEQAHMDAYTVGATKEGTIDWSERDDRLGVVEVLNLIDPVPAEMNRIIDQDGDHWWRTADDPMVWRASGTDHLCMTAHGIEQQYGIKEWSAE